MLGLVTSYGDHTGPLAIAHRGGMGLAPENTLAAFGRATALGLTHLETDVPHDARRSSLCFHDAKPAAGDRAPPGGWATSTSPTCAGCGWAAPNQVPTLAEAMASLPSSLLRHRPQGRGVGRGPWPRCCAPTPAGPSASCVAGVRGAGGCAGCRTRRRGSPRRWAGARLTTLVACSRGGVRPARAWRAPRRAASSRTCRCGWGACRSTPSG